MKLSAYCGFLVISTVFHAAGAEAGGRIIAWGMNVGVQAPGVASSQFATGFVAIRGVIVTNATSVSAGSYHGLARKSDGTVVGWGYNDGGQATGTPSSNLRFTNGAVVIGGHALSEVAAVVAGDGFSLALKNDGRVIGWGKPERRASVVPGDLTNAVAISAGKHNALAARKDGTLLHWGDYDVPIPTGLSNVVGIACGGGRFERNVALRRDGTVCAWGENGEDASVRGVSNVVAVAVGEFHSLALRSDETVYGWGQNTFGEATGVPTAEPLFSSGELVKTSGKVLTNVVAVAAGNEHGMMLNFCRYSLALKKDGTVVVWGKQWDYDANNASVLTCLTNIVAISAGQTFCLAIQNYEAGKEGGK
jgi:alpha-tubulin suppressor-like RCC1 family protein